MGARDERIVSKALSEFDQTALRGKGRRFQYWRVSRTKFA
jgi:hypothetical protein